jgi:hypothetical protein
MPGLHLINAIETVIDGWNNGCHPFISTKTADELLPHYRPVICGLDAFGFRRLVLYADASSRSRVGRLRQVTSLMMAVWTCLA